MIDFKKTNWVNIKVGVTKYQFIMDKFHNCDVSKDREFQKKFNGFYKVMLKSAKFYETFYDFLEKNKNNNLSYEETLTYLYNKVGTIEASFSSKLIATINHDLPILDANVLNRLNLKKPKYSLSKDIKLKETIKVYKEIVKWYDNLDNEYIDLMVKEFDKHLGKTNISDTKKIDFILWQTLD